MSTLEEYIPIVGRSVIEELRLLSPQLRGKCIQHINSTAVGGGVAEILNRMIPLMRELGVDACWDVIKGGEKFFLVTKKFHNVLHGRCEEVTPEDIEAFMETSRKNNEEMNIYGDVVLVHDPQPIALVERRNGNKWIWRCHIDISNPDPLVWGFLKKFIVRYEGAVFSAPSFSQLLPNRQFLVAPSIDPLSDKNKELPQEVIDRVFEKYQIPRDRPIITQISRFDRLKDPLGVIAAYAEVKKNVDCILLLAGGGAADDPEGVQVLEEVRAAAHQDPDIHVLLLQQNDIEINALQRGSTVIIQKSLKEGFGLTVSEALWKGKPVVASNVGGIPLQVKHRQTGLLCHSAEGAAFAIKQLLNNPAWARQLGENGREHIRTNFLITRQIRDHLMVYLAPYYREDVVYLH
jgi:trehalose synthase